jgi:hypothetical protein
VNDTKIGAAVKSHRESTLLRNSFSALRRHDGVRASARKPVLVLVFVAVLGQLAPASAEESRVYAGASGFVSLQGSHVQGSAPSLPTTGARGTALGVGVEGAVF